MVRILVTGATGQIGTELTRELRRRFGQEHVIAASRHRPPDDPQHQWGPFVELDVTDREPLNRLILCGRMPIGHVSRSLGTIVKRRTRHFTKPAIR